MTPNRYNAQQKKIYFKAYKELFKLENALKYLNEEHTDSLQVSILGKVAFFYVDKALESSRDITIIKSYWKDLFGKTINFGTFYNPESGSVFIAGALATTFLHKINGKSLATLSSGPYGIFRGIGVSGTEATEYLKLLNEGNYLLILRGSRNVLHKLAPLLGNT